MIIAYAFMLRVLLTPFFLGYPLVLAHLYVGIRPASNKKILIGLNLLLIVFYIFMINTGAFENNFPGFILMLLALGVVVLGVVGSLLIDPNAISLKSKKVQKIVKGLKTAFLIYVGFELLSAFLIVFDVLARLIGR